MFGTIFLYHEHFKDIYALVYSSAVVFAIMCEAYQSKCLGSI